MCAKIAIDSNRFTYYESDKLKQLMVKICVKLGFSEEDALIVATMINKCDLRGVDTHGIRMITPYGRRVLAGGFNVKANITVEKDTPTMAVVDGDFGMGQCVGFKAMNLAIEKAKANGIGFVWAKHSNHFGAAGNFAMLAQEQGLVGISMTNVNAKIPPTGGITPCFGNDPWSVAFPVREGQIPVVIDMAMSVVANTNIIMARELGTKIPKNWALTVEGEETDDPNLARLLLPFGGYKGYALAFAVEYFAGILSGAGIGRDVSAFDVVDKPHNCGHMFAAIDPFVIMGKDEYNERLDGFINNLRTSKLAPGVDRVYVPGEKEYDAFVERTAKGIPLADKYIAEINNFCEELGLAKEL